MRAAAWSLAMSSLLGLASPASPVVPGDVQAAVRDRVDFGYTPGMVVGMIDAGGRTTWSYGARSWEDPAAPDGTTIYEIASVTKTFTASLLSQMVEAGDLSLDDPVALHLPPGTQMPANGGAAITLEHLATHHSGLPSMTPFPECLHFDPENSLAGYGPEEIYEFLANFTLPRAPGSGFEYSNLGIGLLGHALAYSQGMSYEALLRERILDPLGMGDTAITLTAEQRQRRVAGHGGFVPRPPFIMDELAPAGALVSTADDLLIYLQHHMGLVSGGPLNDALAATHGWRGANPPIGGGIGLAWWRWNIGGLVVQHGGDSIGSAAFVGFRPSTGVGAVVLSNSRRHQNAELRDLGFRCLGVIPDVLPTTAPAAVPIADQLRYVGRYDLAGTEIAIGIFRDQLTLISNGIEATLYPRGGRRFTYFDAAGNADFVFELDAGGESTGATLDQLGQTFTMPRVTGPPVLEAARVCDEVELWLRAEPLMTYELQASGDGETWSTMGEISIKGRRYREAIGEGARVFRIVAPAK